MLRSRRDFGVVELHPEATENEPAFPEQETAKWGGRSTRTKITSMSPRRSAADFGRWSLLHPAGFPREPIKFQSFLQALYSPDQI